MVERMVETALSIEAIEEFMEKVKEKALNKEFTIEFKYDDQYDELWFDFSSEDYSLNISKLSHNIALSEMEKDENEYRFKRVDYKNVECFECFLNTIEKTIKELALKYRHKEFFLKVSK